MGSQHSNIILLSFTLKLPSACRPSSPGWGEHPPGSKGLPRAEGEGGPENHDGVISHLEPDILDCEVQWALGSITMKKASGGDGIPVELFQILEDDAVKVLHSICQQIWKLIRSHRTGKGQFSFQSLRKTMPKIAQTTAQLYSSHMLVK